MLIAGSHLTVKDNSGILLAQCIQISKSTQSKKPGKVGDFLKATGKKSAKSRLLKRVKNKTAFSKPSGLCNLVIIQSKKALRRLDGQALRFSENSGVIVAATAKKKQQPLFKRVNTAVPFELKKNCGEVLNLAKSVI